MTLFHVIPWTARLPTLQPEAPSLSQASSPEAVSSVGGPGFQSQIGEAWRQELIINMNSGFGPGTPKNEDYRPVTEGRERGGFLPRIRGIGRTGKAPVPVPAGMAPAAASHPPRGMERSSPILASEQLGNEHVLHRSASPPQPRHVPHSQFTQIQGKGRNNADGIDIEPPFNGMFYSARPFPNYKDVDISDIGPLSLTLFVAASLCPFDYDGADTKKNYPWLTYMEGEIFHVGDTEGEVWLAKNGDDLSGKLGWIWNQHCVEISSN